MKSPDLRYYNGKGYGFPPLFICKFQSILDGICYGTFRSRPKNIDTSNMNNTFVPIGKFTSCWSRVPTPRVGAGFRPLVLEQGSDPGPEQSCPGGNGGNDESDSE